MWGIIKINQKRNPIYYLLVSAMKTSVAQQELLSKYRSSLIGNTLENLNILEYSVAKVCDSGRFGTEWQNEL